jgi:hypothetical protein
VNLNELYCGNNNFSEDYINYLKKYCRNKYINLNIW